MQTNQPPTPVEQIQQMAEELREGHMPTTAQAEHLLEKVERDILPEVRHHAHLSRAGEELTFKTQRLVRDAKVLLHEKNPENELQEMLHQLQLGKQLLEEPVEAAVSPVKRTQLQDDLQKITEDLRALLTRLSDLSLLFVRSFRFRRLTGNYVSLVRDFLTEVSRVSEEAREKLAEKERGGEQKEEAKAVEETGKEAAEKAKEELLSDETIDRLLDRVKTLAVETMSQRTYQRGVEQVLMLFEDLYNRSSKVLATSEDLSADLREEARAGLHCLEHAQESARSLLERLAGRSLQPVVDSFTDVFEMLRSNEEIRQFVGDAGEYLKKLIADKEFVEGDAFKSDGRALFERYQRLSVERQSLNEAAHQLSVFSQAIASDRYLSRFAADWSDLMASLFLDERGRLTLKTELLFDMPKLFALSVEMLGQIPVTQIAEIGTDLDYTIDHIYISTDKLEPKLVEVIASSYFNEGVTRRTESIIRLTLGKIGASAKDVRFTYNKKSLPSLKDAGLADINIGENGLSIYAELIPELDNPQCVYRVGKVECTVTDLDLRIHDAKHTTLYTLFWPFVKARVRTGIEQGVAGYVRDLLTKVQGQFVELRNAYLLEEGERAQVCEHPPQLLPTWGSTAFNA